MTLIDRRRFLVATTATSAAVLAGPAFWRAAYAAPVQPGPSPYGPLAATPDANGLLLPPGFTSRVIARSGQAVAGTTYVWPPFPDGAATFTTPGGGWLCAINSEVLAGGGGASAVRFAADGTVVDAYAILTGTSGNCAGGQTPWGTWLSCEEAQSPSNVGEGQVWECDPTTPSQGIARPAMGRFNHEAVAVDPTGQRLYLTEDRSDGRFYRFTPTSYPDLSTGTLEVAAVDSAGTVTWLLVPDPSASTATTRTQVPESSAFDGGEGCWYDTGHVYFTTKGDNRVWSHDLTAHTITVLYDAADFGDAAPLTGVDNVVVSSAGDLYVAEDGGNMEINIITPDRVVAPVVRYTDNDESEITGPVFDPSGTRLYFSSQRGPGPGGPGITFEVSGPFRIAAQTAAPTSSAPTTTPATAALAPNAPSRVTAAGALPATGAPPTTRRVGALLALVGAAGWAIGRRVPRAADPGSPATDVR
ncbi:MAG: alkaline phosphatase PhoX [Acidimicrobiales bacterium]